MNKETFSGLEKEIFKKSMDKVLKQYFVCIKASIWLMRVIVLLFTLIIIYNVFFAGKSYTLSDYYTIKNTMLIIVLLLIILILGVSIILIWSQIKLRRIIKEASLSNNIAYKDLRDEINIMLKSEFGGPGIIGIK